MVEKFQYDDLWIVADGNGVLLDKLFKTHYTPKLWVSRQSLEKALKMAYREAYQMLRVLQYESRRLDLDKHKQKILDRISFYDSLILHHGGNGSGDFVFYVFGNPHDLIGEYIQCLTPTNAL